MMNKQTVCVAAALGILIAGASRGWAAEKESEPGTPTVVRYGDFGARGDGRTDDIEAIAKAHAFANTHGLPVKADGDATYFIGGKDKPTPLSDEEAEKIIEQMTEGALKPKPKYLFERGDEVRVIDGPFSNFNGLVDEVNHEKGKVRVLVSIFGRSTPVELEFVQVTKI